MVALVVVVMIAVFVVLGSALCASLAYCTIRKLKTDPRALEVTATRFYSRTCSLHVHVETSLGGEKSFRSGVKHQVG